MMNQKLNDREEQVCIAALFYFLQHVSFWSKGKAYQKVNEHDILSPGHTKAHIITAVQKLSGQPITHAFQNPSSAIVQKLEQERQDTITDIRSRLVGSGLTPERADQLLTIATLQ